DAAPLPGPGRRPRVDEVGGALELLDDCDVAGAAVFRQVPPPPRLERLQLAMRISPRLAGADLVGAVALDASLPLVDGALELLRLVGVALEAVRVLIDPAEFSVLNQQERQQRHHPSPP